MQRTKCFFFHLPRFPNSCSYHLYCSHSVTILLPTCSVGASTWDFEPPICQVQRVYINSFNSTPWMLIPTRVFMTFYEKSSHLSAAGLLQQLPVPTSTLPLTLLSSHNERKHNFLTIVNWFSKTGNFLPLTKLCTALETAQLLVTHLPDTYIPTRHCLRRWYAIYATDVGSLLLTSQGQRKPLLGFPPSVEWSNGKLEVETGSHPQMLYCHQTNVRVQSF